MESFQTYTKKPLVCRRTCIYNHCMSRKSILKSMDHPTQSTVNLPTLRFVLEQRTEQMCWDLRIEADGSVFVWRMHQPPSTNPLRVVSACFKGLDVSNKVLLESEILVGDEFGWVKPMKLTGASQARSFHQQFVEGRLELWVEGGVLQGGFVLEGRGDQWRIRKIADEYASIVEPQWAE